MKTKWHNTKGIKVEEVLLHFTEEEKNIYAKFKTYYLSLSLSLYIYIYIFGVLSINMLTLATKKNSNHLVQNFGVGYGSSTDNSVFKTDHIFLHLLCAFNGMLFLSF